MELKESLKLLPKQPGIYFMMDSMGVIIYVGKAKNLKSRVSQYFHKNKENSPKTNDLIKHIKCFKYITTDTELEALLLECKTIRELKPKYNRMLKNCKGYKYIKISIYENYPKLSMVSMKKKDGSLYFGPFTSEGFVENTIEFIKYFYPIRKCTSDVYGKGSAGCLNFHLGTCMGPCRENDIQAVYMNEINNIVQFLEGNDCTPLHKLYEKMNSSAENLDFEKAAKYRDQIKSVRYVLNKQKIIKISSCGRNILAIERCGEAESKLFFIKGNKLLHIESVNLLEHNNTAFGDKLKILLKTYFKSFERGEEVGLSQEDIDEAQIIYSYLKNKNNGIRNIKVPASRIDKINYKKIEEFIFK